MLDKRSGHLEKCLKAVKICLKEVNIKKFYYVLSRRKNKNIIL